MPFKSQKQRAYFHHLKSVGKMDQKTIDKWEEHTPKDKKLPVRVEKRAMLNSFWNGFCKKAEENFVSAASTNKAPGAPEKLLKWNPHGGVDPRTPEDLQAAQAAGLVTLPPDVEGAKCETCVHFRPITPELMHGFCTNPAVKQDVTGNMHCVNWEHPGVHNPAEAAAEEAQAAQLEQAQAAQQGLDPSGQAMAGADMTQQGGAPAAGQAMAGGSGNPGDSEGKDRAGASSPPSALESNTEKPSSIGTQSGFPAGSQNPSNPLAEKAMSDFQGEAASAGPTGMESQPSSEPKKPAKKKPAEGAKKKDDSKGNTINIHVGKGTEKTSSMNFWKGIF